ncbi:MAG: sigma-70 family RNA polymerase sigma factor [Clostridia bacterium]
MNAEERNRFISDLYDEYYDLLKRYCFSRMSDDPILREQAIDCVQTTFEIAIKNCEKLLASKNMGGWLMQTCQYVVLAAKKKHFKRRSNEVISTDAPEFPEFALLHADDVFENWLSNIEACEELDAILCILSDGEASIIHEVVFEGKTTSNIAKERMVSLGTIKGILYRMRKRLRAEQNKTIK